MLDDSILDKYRLAGKICAAAAEHARTLVKPGVSARLIVDEIEGFIVERGASLSFPVNISLNEVAAHYSPGIIPQDDFALPDEGLLKIDIGTHVDGYIADHAISIDIGETGGLYQKLIEAASAALDAAVQHFHAGQNVLYIGKLIEDEISSRGFQPIRNLGGHNLGEYSLHGGIFVPNTPSGTPYTLKAGDVFAVEPFSTNGKGSVFDGTKKYIFRFAKRAKRRLPERDHNHVELVRKHFNTLPFSPRWLEGRVRLDSRGIMSMIGGFVAKGIFQAYPVLVEQGRGLVAQAEHTIIVHEDRGEIMTTP